MKNSGNKSNIFAEKLSFEEEKKSDSSKNNQRVPSKPEAQKISKFEAPAPE